MDLKRICSNLLSLYFDVKHWKARGCNESPDEINVQRYVQCATSVRFNSGFLHFAINEWSFVVKQNVRCQQYRFHLFPNKYSANCSIPRSGRKSDWSIDWNPEIGERTIGEKMEKGEDRVTMIRANETERMYACVNHNQLLNIITAKSEANR